MMHSTPQVKNNASGTTEAMSDVQLVMQTEGCATCCINVPLHPTTAHQHQEPTHSFCCCGRALSSPPLRVEVAGAPVTDAQMAAAAIRVRNSFGEPGLDW